MVIVWMLAACDPAATDDSVDAQPGGVVSNGESWADHPCLSPDGKVLAYTSYTDGWRTGASALELFEFATGTHKTIVVSAGQGNVNSSGRCFSNDSARVSYVSDREDRWEVWISGLLGGEKTRVTYREGYSASGVVHSGGGEYVVFESVPDGGTDSTITVVHTDGSEERALTEGTADDRQPAPHPQDGSVLFNSDRDGSRGLYTVPFDGGDVEMVYDTPADETDGSWSMNGQYVIFATDNCAGNQCIATWTPGAVDVVVEREGWWFGSPTMATDGSVYAVGCESSPDDGCQTAVYRIER